MNWDKIGANAAVGFFSALIAANIANLGIISLLLALINAGIVAGLAGALEWKRETDGNTPPETPAVTKQFFQAGLLI